MKDGQELVEAPTTAMQVFDEYEQEIVQFEQYFADKKYDLTNEEGIKLCEGDLLLLRKVEIRIDKTRKSRGKSLRDAVTELNDSAKVCHNRVHAMWEVLDKPLQVIRQKILNDAMDIRDAEIAEEKRIETEALAVLEAREKKVAAGLAKIEAADRKEELEAAALLAAENATLKAAQDAIDAEANADQNVLDAIAETQRQAKVEADALAKKAADLYEAEQADRDKLAAEHQARVADLDHRRDYNNIASQAIFIHCGDVEVSEGLVRAIVKGEIPNVTLNY